MSRYIDADKFYKDEISRCGCVPLVGSGEDDYKSLRDVLNEAPTADVIEVKHGEWKYEQLDEYKFYKVTCPYCNAYYMGNYDAYNDPDNFNYCPNCGAKMDGERSENGKS